MSDSDNVRFLAQVPRDKSAIGNNKLREELGWKEARYVRVRDALVQQGQLEKGRGYGGTVRLITAKAGRRMAGAAVRAVSGARAGKSRASLVQRSVQPLSVLPADKKRSKNARPTSGNAMFEQTFKNIDDVLWKDAGCTSELDYTEQSSWLLFLKYLDALEQDKATEAKLDGKKYTHILGKEYRWEMWAAPKGQCCSL